MATNTYAHRFQFKSRKVLSENQMKTFNNGMNEICQSIDYSVVAGVNGWSDDERARFAANRPDSTRFDPTRLHSIRLARLTDSTSHSVFGQHFLSFSSNRSRVVMEIALHHVHKIAVCKSNQHQ